MKAPAARPFPVHALHIPFTPALSASKPAMPFILYVKKPPYGRPFISLAFSVS